MQGTLFKKGGGAFQSWKARWFELKDGTLLYYAKQGGSLKGSINIAHTKIESLETSGKFAFIVIPSSGGEGKMLAAPTMAEKQDWLRDLQGSTEKTPLPGSPKPAKKGARYALESAAAGSLVGKALIKKAMSKDFKAAIDAFNSFMIKAKGEAIATKLHENMERALVKQMLLMHNHQLTVEQIDEIVRHNLILAQLIIDYSQMPSIFDVNEFLKALEVKRTFFTQYVAPLLTVKNAACATYAFSIIMDEALLTDLFTKNKHPELKVISGVMRELVGHLHPGARSAKA
eukprot:TRINITY_DN6571_c0_g1_i3.p1 TRINITY_DN6571_c0_g1~~TRINITY_DN6571_c0_g1_i3.p1  ORF type:complete len:323 (+),score=79.27 TRINITY_DN6571_c0_g1_i3:109-969(+)